MRATPGGGIGRNTCCESNTRLNLIDDHRILEWDRTIGGSDEFEEEAAGDNPAIRNAQMRVRGCQDRWACLS